MNKDYIPSRQQLTDWKYHPKYDKTVTDWMAGRPFNGRELLRFDRRMAYGQWQHDNNTVGIGVLNRDTEPWYGPETASQYVDSLGLTPRQNQIAKLLIAGRLKREIAQLVGVHINTVTRECKRIGAMVLDGTVRRD